jgi:hypothetical protein
VTLEATGRAEVAAFTTRNSNFGQPSTFDDNTANQWQEGFIRPQVTAEYTLGSSTLYGGVSGVASFTRGTGEPSGFTTGNPDSIDKDELYVGWRNDWLDISAGAQSYYVGDKFLIGDGRFDSGSKGALWLSPRDAFKNTAIVRMNTAPWLTEAFYLKGYNDQADTELVGLNLEYQRTQGTLGLLAMRGIAANAAFNPTNPDNRQGLNVFSLRAHGTPLASAPNWFFSGEVTRQWNNESTRNVRAYAGYAEAAYTFAEAAWTPTLSYRYALFSGDNPNTANGEGFDALFFGYSRGWGTWFLSEVVGEYLIPNTNARVHQMHLATQPTEDTALGGLLLRYDRDERVAATGGKHFADEVNVYGEWQAHDNVRLIAVYGAAAPRTAAKAEYGSGLFQVGLFIASVSF